jgi:hypothetical protein
VWQVHAVEDNGCTRSQREINWAAQTVRSGHSHVRNNASNIPLIELLKKSVRRLVGFDSITEHAEHLAERLANRCMMIYDKDRRVHRHDTCG